MPAGIRIIHRVVRGKRQAMHYTKPPGRRPVIWELRFFAKVDRTSDCWLWTGACDFGGYGVFTPNIAGYGMVKAHRWLYECMVGPVPQGKELDHLCRVRKCVNPWHLEPVTKKENSRRSIPFRPHLNVRNADGTWRKEVSVPR